MPAQRAKTSAPTAAPRASRGRRCRRRGRERPEYRVEALAKGLRILSLFDEQRPSWRVTDLAAAAGLPMPTVYRVVMTLTAEGYLDHLPNGDYRPGVRTLTLGTAALRSLDLVGIATPKLQRARRDAPARRSTWRCSPATGCCTSCGCATPTWSPRTSRSARPCRRSHVDRQAAAGPSRRRRPRARASPTASFAAKHGPNAKVSLDELRTELAQIREQGWAMQDEELAYGLRSVAGPDHGPGRPRRRRGQPRGPGARLVDRSGSCASSSRSCWPPARRSRPARPTAPRHDDGVAPASQARPGMRSTPQQRAVYDAIAGGRRAAGTAAVPARRRRRAVSRARSTRSCCSRALGLGAAGARARRSATRRRSRTGPARSRS